MRIWHCRTQEEYDYLMKQLEAEGCAWIGGDKPTKHNVWDIDREQTCVREICGEVAQSTKNFYEVKFPEIEIQPVVIPERRTRR